MEQIKDQNKTIEGIDFKDYCHIFLQINGKRTDKSYCGIPSLEQPIHAPSMPLGFYNKFEFCPYCGKTNCPKCRRL